MQDRPSVDVAFRFGPFRLIPSQQLLLRDDRAVKLGGRAFDILHFMVMRAGEQLSKSDLIAFVWPDVFVDEHNLKVHISSLRRLLEDTAPHATYIATVVGRGYQFVARVHTERAEIKAFSAPDEDVAITLPECPTLIGRQRDVEGVARALDFARLVTLVGPGGVGKTSLAIAVAHARRDVFPDGIHFADLSVTDDPALVAHLVATCIGIRGDPVDLLGAIVEHLEDRRALLVLDNCEHVLPAVATIAARLIEAKISSCVLATSRGSLGGPGENLQRVEPLAFPRSEKPLSAAEALAYPSVQLFAARAHEAIGYQLDDTDAQTVCSLCEALDGLPLAIEIAVAQLDRFSASELLRSVASRLSELKNGQQSAHSRHETLWATLDWSYRLLSIPEAAIFRLLSVFAGYFEMPDVAHMARLIQFDPFKTTIALGGLVDKSLLSAEIHGDLVCYRLLESAKEYAADALSKEPIARDAQCHHARLVLAAFEQSTVEWSWVKSIVWRGRYEARNGDLRKALDWCFCDEGDASLGVDIAISAIRFWNEQSSISEQLYQVGRALDHSSTLTDAVPRQAILAQSLAYSMTLARKPRHETDQAWAAALRLSERSGKIGQQLSTMYGKAMFLIYSGRNDAAIGVLNRYLELAREAGDRVSVHDGERLSTLANMHLGKLVEVRTTLERLAEDLKQGVPMSSIIRYQEQRYVSIYTTLAFTTWLTGRPVQAQSMTDEMVSKLESIGQLMGLSNILALVALPLALWSGDIGRLDRYLKILGNNLDRESIRMWEPVYRFYWAALGSLRGDKDAYCEMQSATKELVEDKMLIRMPMYQGVLAESLLRSDKVAEAEKEIERGLSLQLQTGEHWCLPELLRIKANILKASGQMTESRCVMSNALSRARVIGALSFELRIIIDQVSEGVDDGAISETLLPLWESLEDQQGTADLERGGRLLAMAGLIST